MLLLAASRLGASGLAVGAPGSPEHRAGGSPIPGRCSTLQSPRRQIMKLILIVLGLLATTGVVYAACVFC